MHALHRFLAQRRSLTWLLWLALLLPMAQSVASWHAHSHDGQATAARADDAQAPHATHCELCLVAAAVSGGALFAAPPALALAARRHEAPLAAAGSVWLWLFTPAYRSRAPPSVPR